MRVASSKMPIRLHMSRVLLDRQRQCRHRLIKALTEELCTAQRRARGADAGAGAETQRGLKMRDCETAVPGPQPENTAAVPTARKARIEGQGAIDQRDRRTDVLAEIGQRDGGIR